MVGTAKSFGIIMAELIKHFNITTATGALVIGVSGAVYTITGNHSPRLVSGHH